MAVAVALAVADGAAAGCFFLFARFAIRAVRLTTWRDYTNVFFGPSRGARTAQSAVRRCSNSISRAPSNIGAEQAWLVHTYAADFARAG